MAADVVCIFACLLFLITNTEYLLACDKKNTVTWIGGAKGDWTNPNNWDNHNIPTATQCLIIPDNVYIYDKPDTAQDGTYPYASIGNYVILKGGNLAVQSSDVGFGT